MGHASMASAVLVLFKSGETKSEPIDISGLKVNAIQFPAGWPGAAIQFEGSATGTAPQTTAVPSAQWPFVPIHSDVGPAYSITAGVSRIVALDAAAMALGPVSHIKLVSDVPVAGDTYVYLIGVN